MGSRGSITELVAPLVEAWIEIRLSDERRNSMMVAPLVEAWIEIISIVNDADVITVAPLVEAWIEIFTLLLLALVLFRRSSRGSVD